MAALAKRHKVVKVVTAVVSQRNNVVDFLHGRQPAMLQTLLAQRVLHNVAVTNFAPFGAILPLIFKVTKLQFTSLIAVLPL